MSENRTFPLLSTKLAVPAARPEFVFRPRLLAKLGKSLAEGQKLLLVSAPAGYGKTTLVSAWLNALPEDWSGAWLALDQSESNPERFLHYIIAALQTIDRNIGGTALVNLGDPLTAATSLLNDLSASNRHIVLALDDCHLLAGAALPLLSYLTENAPVNLRLAVISRTDPPVALARLRSRNQLTEIHAADLCFTAPEAAEFFGKTLRLDLAAGDVAALANRAEGWVTGLQLLALSFPEGSDRSNAVSEMTGASRLIFDYLAEEVFLQQPEPVQRFLLQTATLSRMTGALCDVLTGEGQAMLSGLEHAHLFIVPLDRERAWFRYQHLFAEFLKQYLARHGSYPLPPGDWSPESMIKLYNRAGRWYEKHGFFSEAIEQDLLAGDYEHCARLTEKTARDLLLKGNSDLLLRWLAALPTQVLLAHPHLYLARCWALLLSGQLDTAESILQTWPKDSELAAGIETEASLIAGLLANLRNEPQQAIKLMNKARGGIGENDPFLRIILAINLGVAYDLLGEMAAASRAYDELKTVSRVAGNPTLAALALCQLADLKVLQGRLQMAMGLYQQAEELGDIPEWGYFPIAGMIHLGMGKVYYELNELEAAARHLNICIEMGKNWQSADIYQAGLACLAHVRQAQGDAAAVHNLLQQLEETRWKPLAMASSANYAQASQVRLYLRQGKVAAATRIAKTLPMIREKGASYLQNEEKAISARLLIAQGKPEAALKILEPLAQQVEVTGLVGSLIELQVVSAMALQAAGDEAEAVAKLQRAVRLAAPEGYIRTFADEGAPMAHLLFRTHKNPDEYIRRLWQAINLGGESLSDLSLATHQQAVEQLSDRELQVLRLMAFGLRNQEIASDLFVALSTVKTHINNIYGKLGVANRAQALARAQEMGLLE